MIFSVKVEDNKIGIPIYKSNDFAWFIWKEEETTKDFLKKITRQDFLGKWCEFIVWAQTDCEDDPTFNLTVYDVFDLEDNEYHLVIYQDLENGDNIKNSVCLPFNRLNLLKFYQEYCVGFSNKNIYHG